GRHPSECSRAEIAPGQGQFGEAASAGSGSRQAKPTERSRRLSAASRRSRHPAEETETTKAKMSRIMRLSLPPIPYTDSGARHAVPVASLTYIYAVAGDAQPVPVPAVAGGGQADQFHHPLAVTAHPPHAAESKRTGTAGQNGRQPPGMQVPCNLISA